VTSGIIIATVILDNIVAFDTISVCYSLDCLTGVIVLMCREERLCNFRVPERLHLSFLDVRRVCSFYEFIACTAPLDIHISLLVSNAILLVISYRTSAGSSAGVQPRTSPMRVTVLTRLLLWRLH
jgi:hypothetical protein